jgi:hypothetical protein
LRENLFIKKLQAGETVQLRSKGNSMTPLINSGDLETIVPVDPETLERGDMVYCKVKGSVFTHLLTQIKVTSKGKMFQISNNHGHVNGWITSKNIYGKCVKVER